MNNDEHKKKVMASFDMASKGYDCPGLRFFVESASWLVKNLELKGNHATRFFLTLHVYVSNPGKGPQFAGGFTSITFSETVLRTSLFTNTFKS